MHSLLLLSLAAISVGISHECEGCQAYDCFEDEVNCGADAYLLKYGEKYCRKFNDPETVKKFSPAGQEFVQCTTTCLKAFMQGYINKTRDLQPFTPSQCTALETEAFHSHVQCYLDCKFCSICKTDKSALFSVYEFRDFFSWNALKQIYQVIAACGGPHTCFDLF